MDTRQFEYIAAIADEHYISRAADRLCISQPTLSQFLSRLEDDLGVSLFHRSRHGLTPTAEGQIVIDGARRILEIKEDTLEKIASFAERKKNRLMIGLTPGRSAALFSQIMPRFSQVEPDVDVQIMEAPIQDIDALTRSGDLDFSLITVNPHDESLEATVFAEEEILFAMAASHPLAPDDPEAALADGIDLDRFKNEKFILSKRGYRLRLFVDAFLENQKLEPAVLMEATEIPLICNMIRHGLGVGFIPEAFSRGNPDLLAFPVKPKLTWHFGAVYRKGMRLTPGMRRFMEIAKDYARRD
jgi:DNA-binding transcriptional LysR family regulator